MEDVGRNAPDLVTPKRGAFPTPKAVIESATPFIPNSDQEGDQSGTEPIPPTTDDEEEDGSRSNW